MERERGKAKLRVEGGPTDRGKKKAATSHPTSQKKNSQNRPNPMQRKLRLFGLVLQSSPLYKGLRRNTIFSLTLLQIAKKILGLQFIKNHVVSYEC